MLVRVCDRCRWGSFLTVIIQEELVEAQAAGLFADEAVHVLCAVVMHSDGVFQWFNTRLQAERNLCVANSVPGRHKETRESSTRPSAASLSEFGNSPLINVCADLYQNEVLRVRPNVTSGNED